MLNLEAAKRQLEQWQLPDSDDDDDTLLKSAARLSKATRTIAYALLQRDADGNEPSRNSWQESLKKATQSRAQLDRLPAGQRRAIFEAFFPHLAVQVEQGWQFLKTTPYTFGYVRKAFRSPSKELPSLPKRCAWLGGLLRIAAKYQGDIMTAPWLAAWAPFLNAGDDIGQLLAGVIAAGGPLADEVFEILAQSVRNEHEVGGMGLHAIRGLLLSPRADGWQLIEKTLLAAQRQEGLRQSILEAIDECHPQAFRRMLRLIQEQNLARFSSVVRAVDVWFGFGFDSVDAKVVNDAIGKVLQFLDDEAARRDALEGKNAEAAYLALWSIAYEDAHAAIGASAKLLEHDNTEHRFGATVLLGYLGLPEARKASLPALADEDLRVAWRALAALAPNEEEEDEEQQQPIAGKDTFERLERLYGRLPAKPTASKPILWPWSVMRFDRRTLAEQMFQSLGSRPPTRLLPYLADVHPYRRKMVVELLSKQKKWDSLTRESLLGLAGDAGSDVRQASYEALAGKRLEQAEAERLEGYLTRKTSDLRRGIVGLLAQQKDDDALASADRLMAAKDPLQRLASLDLLRGLAEANRQRESCQDRAEAYQSARKQLTPEEQIQLKAIRESGQERITLDNALGLMNPAERSPIVEPKPRKVSFMTPAAINCLKGLDDLVHEHREDIVEFEWGNNHFRQMLGTLDYRFPQPELRHPPEKCKTTFLLREVWENWNHQRGEEMRDGDGLELVRATVWYKVRDWDWSNWKEWMKRSPEHRRIAQVISGGHEIQNLRYQPTVSMVLNWLIYLQPPPNAVDVLLDMVETSFALVPKKVNERLVELSSATENELDRSESSGEPDWRDQHLFSMWLEALRSFKSMSSYRLNTVQWTRFWHLMHWRDQPIAGALRHRPDLELLKKAYAASAATQADWYDQLLGPRHKIRYYSISFDDLGSMTSLQFQKHNEAYFQRFPEIKELVDRCRHRILEIELARGEETTPATLPATKLASLFSIDTLLRILERLGRQSLKIEHGWNQHGHGRAATLTHLIGITYPKPADTPHEFDEKLKHAVANGAIPEERVLQLAFHAPQWSRFIENYLAWPGFSEGLYWFLAHMKYIGDTGAQAAAGAGVTSDEKDDKEARTNRSAWDVLIAERTPLSAEDRNEGAVDVKWFQRIYAQLTPKRWELMSKAARYASTTPQAKRAQFIADVLLGKASRKVLIAGIRKKFLKENVRLLGLLPLPAGSKRDADLAERYRVLQEYRRYAKQLSSMTKEGALRAVEIGMQNLARTAGYPDPLRLEWAMEADSVKDLARGSVKAECDGVTASLALNELAQPVLTVSKNEKELKSIPAEIKKKSKPIAALAERVTDLKRQSSRMRQSLETAMCRGDTIAGAELIQLCQHALLAPLLGRLVLKGDSCIGYSDKGGKALLDYRGKSVPIKKNETLRIAHSHDLLAAKDWEAWQHDCFESGRIQPFKQVFRELYVVTKQEKSDGTLSRRYAGQQVNPTQAYALWGQRGWNVKEGVWLTFYDVGITAHVDFNFGITTPLEVEGLTIETVQFHQRDVSGPLKLAAVPPRLFSEVMRDLDLVVSVAHRGEVDPEASASTVAMRATLLSETCQLLNLKNVRLKDNYAVVDGELGKYSIHLGSAVVHKMPGGSLCIVPVHAQHRGRLFLPFADDDPKTAEVISKVLLLARDAEIQDPVILDQLRNKGV